MSEGWRIALGIYFIVAGACGYERYMSEGRKGRAFIDMGLAAYGVFLLATSIDRLLP